MKQFVNSLTIYLQLLYLYIFIYAHMFGMLATI